MRIKIREQLSILVTILALFCVGIPSLISWVQNYRYVVAIRTNRLAIVAQLKADQLTQGFTIYQNSISSVASRLLIQTALRNYNTAGNDSADNWYATITDIAVALDTQPYLLQAVLWNANLTESLVNVTCYRAIGMNGITNSTDYLAPGYQPSSGGYSWQGHAGFPDSLYPRASNATETDTERLDLFTQETLLRYNYTFQGPTRVNSSLYLASYTVPVIDQAEASRSLLGFFTIVVDAQILVDIANQGVSLDQTGVMLVVGPNNPTNLWSGEDLSDQTVSSSTEFRFVLPAYEHMNVFNISGPMSSLDTVTEMYHNGRNAPAQSKLSATDRTYQKFSVGYVLTAVPYVDWGVLIAQSYDEVLAPVVKLRNVLLATVFGTCGVVILLVWPLAHCFVRPVTSLSHATQNSKPPSSFTPSRGSPHGSALSLTRYHDGTDSVAGIVDADAEKTHHRTSNVAVERNSPCPFRNIAKIRKYAPHLARNEASSRLNSDDNSRNTFRIPSKVPERRHFIHDELTDLTYKFNRMTEELEQQYETLEDRVRERTIQLQEQRQIAETANEAKSRFIANITHELRTPLNGILGMCAVCLAEDDITRIKQSLGIVYKSGELLLHLLTDLLTFSKTQIGGHAMSLDMKRFRIVDITSQVMAIFAKQAKDGKISLSVQTVPEMILHDMVLLGDSNRILQIIINLISNALKFTPEYGSVKLTISLEDESGRLAPKAVPNSRASSRHRLHSTLISRGSISEPSFVPHDPKLTASSLVTSLQPWKTQDMRKRASVVSESPSIDMKDYIFEFTVQDSGPGIPIDQQQKVFEPFVQGELGLNKKYGGTGLGLSICRQLALLMSGTIDLESTEGLGSMFIFKLPLKHLRDGITSSAISSREGSISHEHYSPNVDQTELHKGTGQELTDPEKPVDSLPISTPDRLAALLQPRLVGLSQPYFASSQESTSTTTNLVMIKGNLSKDARDPRNIRVLVAEDNKINQEVVLRMLKLERIEDVTVAEDGIQAVEKIKAAIEAGKAFHVVFMDVQMPNLDGLESTRIIRDLGYSAPIIALSALTEESNIQECLESGMNHFLAKPIRRPALKQVLKTYCSTIAEDEDSISNPVSGKS